MALLKRGRRLLFIDMAARRWKSQAEFERDLRSASLEDVRSMLAWASDHEESADRPGMGRNPKARRMFRLMRVAARNRLADLGYPDG